MKYSVEDSQKARAILKRVMDTGVAMSAAENEFVNDVLHAGRAMKRTKSLDDYTGNVSRGFGGRPGEDSLYGAIKAQGFDRITKSQVEVSFKAATVDGGSDVADMEPLRVGQPPLGFDDRFLAPALPTRGIAPDATVVQSFRQKSRNLGTATAGIRDIDATTEKPEVGTVTEIVNEPVKQIAWIESGVPNIYLENDNFRGWIDQDLRLAYSRSVDAHILAQIAAASPGASATGINELEQVVYGIESVLAQGYSPNVLAASPAFLIELDLLKQPTSDDYVGGQMDRLISRLRRVPVVGLADPYVMDATAAGEFSVSPTRFAVFEENDGKTNTSRPPRVQRRLRRPAGPGDREDRRGLVAPT